MYYIGVARIKKKIQPAQNGGYENFLSLNMKFVILKKFTFLYYSFVTRVTPVTIFKLIA